MIPAGDNPPTTGEKPYVHLIGRISSNASAIRAIQQIQARIVEERPVQRLASACSGMDANGRMADAVCVMRDTDSCLWLWRRDICRIRVGDDGR